MQPATTNVTIVEARPEHVPFIAWVMLTAARSHVEKGMWDFMAGPDEARTLRFLEALASTEEPHWAHHSLFLVAEAGGRPASALCGYFDEEHGTATLAPMLPAAAQAAGMTPDELMAAWQEGLSIAQVAPEHVAGVWIVEHVATLPEFRRQGLVDRLLAAVLDKGRARGATVGDVGVLIGNDRAQRAYEKAGFRVTGEKRHPEFEAAYGCPGIRELSRPL
jgi:ribosomal protein S18 acetylase RimI-like enzyme